MVAEENDSGANINAYQSARNGIENGNDHRSSANINGVTRKKKNRNAAAASARLGAKDDISRKKKSRHGAV